MDSIDISKRQIGINFHDHLAQANVWAPKVNDVSLVLGEKILPMSKESHGYWQVITAELKPGEPYRIALDGKPFPDVAALVQPDVHGDSIALDLNNFTWSDQEWCNPELASYIFYELHTGTFSPEGNFAAIESRLDYLLDLGITAVELMPVAQFSGERNWGYDGVFPFAVQHSYGGSEGLRNLVNACHRKGLAVVLDVVYNHIGPEGNYFGLYGPYFTEKYQTPWGNALNFDDADCDPVRRYFIESTLMWFRDFHIDALRLDAVHAIKDFSPKHILQELKEYTERLSQSTGKKYYLIIECDLNDPRFINPVTEGGFSMDGQWTDEFHHALRVAAGEPKQGYYSDFNGLASLAEAYKHAYVYHGQYSEHRRKYFGADPVYNPGQQFVVFSQNHDQVGNRMLGERSSQLFSFEMRKLMAASIMVSPFLPMLFMGEEFSATAPFLYFVSHSEPELIAAVRKGRKEEFAAFHAEGEAPDPQDIKTFERSKLNWSKVSQGQQTIMLSYYKALIGLRKMNPDLQANGRESLAVAFDETRQTLWLKRGQIGCLMNFTAEQVITTFPESLGKADLLFDSAATEWGGPENAPPKISSNQSLTQQGESILIYKFEHV